MRRRAMAAIPLLLSFPRLARASFINYSSREINCKIVYYGPGAGLRENLEYVYAKTAPDAKGKLIKLATENEDVLFFDFLPLSLGEIRGFKTRFHLYTVPKGSGSTDESYAASRELILKGVDGIVFVADANPDSAKENVRSLMALRTQLAKQGYDFEKMPVVFQVARLDPTTALPTAEVAKTLLPGDRQLFEADPVKGTGVFDSLKAIAKLVLMELKKGAAEPPPGDAAPSPNDAVK